MMPPYQYPAPNERSKPADFARIIGNVLQGRLNVTGIGEVTGDGGATVVDGRCHEGSVVLLSPMEMDVQMAVVAYYVGSFDIVWDAVGNRTFQIRYIILG